MQPLLLLLVLVPATAFVVPMPVQPCTFAREAGQRLYSSSQDNDEEGIEAARRQLEFLVNDDSNNEKDAPLLSTIGRQRREVEIALLEALEFGDEPTDDLWQLWYSERGPQAHADLQELEAGLFDPKNWSDAEARLQEMIAQHGMHFCEPLNRLATLYYMQGRYQESKKLCQLVLEQKPWHFGALSGIVMVCANLQDIQGARQWAARRLPPMVPDGTTDNERRKEWADRAVDDARQRLVEEEERIRVAFGKRQRYIEEQQPEEDAWQ